MVHGGVEDAAVAVVEERGLDAVELAVPSYICSNAHCVEVNRLAVAVSLCLEVHHSIDF